MEDAGGFAEGAGTSVDTRRLAYIPEYRVYNREREIERQERERKEKQWEEELNTAMKGAEERLKYARVRGFLGGLSEINFYIFLPPFFYLPSRSVHRTFIAED